MRKRDVNTLIIIVGRAASVLLLCLGILLLGACRSAPSAAEDLRITIDQVDFAPDSPVVGDAIISLRVLREGVPLPGATVALRGDMTHAGMQPVERSGVTAADGVARIPFTWTMGGDWIVSLRITAPDGGLRTGRFEMVVSGEGAPGS
jgi:hypothetical protein